MTDIPFHPLFPLDLGSLHYFSVLGRALFTAQHLEMNCRAIEGFLLMRQSSAQYGSSVIEDPTFQKGIDKLWRKTLDQHVHLLAERGVLPSDVAPMFRTAVDARNEIAHSVAMDVSELDEAELDEHIKHILGLVRSISEADKIASIILLLLNKESPPKGDFFATYEDQVTAWVSENTFEE